MNIDTSHLHALELGLLHERQRLAAATSATERQARAVWVRQLEREVAAERQFLGLPAVSSEPMTDDEIMQALLTEGLL